MNGCMKCEIISRICSQKQDIYLSTKEPFLLTKICEMLYSTGFLFSNLIDVILVKDFNFSDLINTLHKQDNLTDAERDSIMILPLCPGETLLPQHLFSAKTLNSWFELLNSKDILYIIKNRSITTYCQPIVTAKQLNVYAYECLSRGVTEDGSLIYPSELFTKANVMGLLFALDRIAREVSLESCHSKGLTKNKIFINFLPTAIYNPQECLKTTLMTVERLDLDPNKIVFEVVESERVDNLKHLKNIFDYYQSLGFMIALDDFGTGYSSLKMLDVLTPNYVKIDMHFVRNIHLDHFKQEVIKAIVSIAKSKNVKTIAEGIESYDEYLKVVELGVDLLQGYFFARPEPNINPDIYKPEAVNNFV